jgi:hypothetical protein
MAASHDMEAAILRTSTKHQAGMLGWEASDAEFPFDLESRWETVRYLVLERALLRARSNAGKPER